MHRSPYICSGLFLPSMRSTAIVKYLSVHFSTWIPLQKRCHHRHQWWNSLHVVPTAESDNFLSPLQCGQERQTRLLPIAVTATLRVYQLDHGSRVCAWMDATQPVQAQKTIFIKDISIENTSGDMGRRGVPWSPFSITGFSPLTIASNTWHMRWSIFAGMPTINPRPSPISERKPPLGRPTSGPWLSSTRPGSGGCYWQPVYICSHKHPLDLDTSLSYPWGVFSCSLWNGTNSALCSQISYYNVLSLKVKITRYSP